jgi:hypothetical protein
MRFMDDIMHLKIIIINFFFHLKLEWRISAIVVEALSRKFSMDMSVNFLFLLTASSDLHRRSIQKKNQPHPNFVFF